jgi:putative transposase
MRNPLERRYGHGDLHFITFSCNQRRPLLGNPDNRDAFLRILSEVRAQYIFRLIGYVVMPEHIHLLVTEPKTDDPSRVLQVLKQRVARSLLKRVTSTKTDRSHFWQRRFYDFNVWSGNKITEKLNYMHLNPVKRNLVAHPRDWPWSSWGYYSNEGNGLISIDRWGGPMGCNENPHP